MAESGYPGTKRAVGGSSLERVQYEASKAADEVVVEHELKPDPHPQYQLEADMPTLAYYIKWGMV